MEFWKGHALGNDYIVVDGTADGPPSTGVVRGLCDRHRGVGGDGVLVADESRDPVALRIFNPDGTEAEKSGNGLRIFGAWLHARGRVGSAPFHVALRDERVEMTVDSSGPGGVRVLSVEMGRASFRAGDIPFTDAAPEEEVLGRSLPVDGHSARIHLVSLGNPHCVLFEDDALDVDTFRRLAPTLQAHPAFERGINVQLVRVTDRDVHIRIHERGAGETLASGSSACAVAAILRRTGRTPAATRAGKPVEVQMPGGTVEVTVRDDWTIRLTGEAGIVYSGRIGEDVVDGWKGDSPRPPV